MFVTIAAMTLIVAAVLGSCDKLDLAQNTNVSPESNTGTQTLAAYTLETITPTKPPTINTPTLPPPTETPTVTPTQTPNPTPTPEIPYLIAQFSLNPDRLYTIVETESGARYLRDEHNQALMLKYVVIEESGQQIGEWVDTSLEEKYGHLVPENEGLYTRVWSGNPFFDTTCSNADLNDPRYQFLEIGVRPTGNFRVETAILPGMDAETVNIYGGVVFRDNNHTLRHLDVRFDVIDPNQEILLRIAGRHSTDYGVSGGAYALIDSVDQILEFYDQPGRAYTMELMFAHPRQSIPSVGCLIPNTRHQANYQDYLNHAPDFQELVDRLLGSSDALVIPDSLIIPAQAVKYIDTLDNLRLLNLWSPSGS